MKLILFLSKLFFYACLVLLAVAVLPLGVFAPRKFRPAKDAA